MTTLGRLRGLCRNRRKNDGWTAVGHSGFLLRSGFGREPHTQGIPKCFFFFFLSKCFLEAWGTKARQPHFPRQMLVFWPGCLRRHGQKTTMFRKRCRFLALTPQASKNLLAKKTTQGSRSFFLAKWFFGGLGLPRPKTTLFQDNDDFWALVPQASQKPLDQQHTSGSL